MKTRSLLSLSAALVGALLLVVSALARPAGNDSVAVRLELDREILPADARERAIVKVCLDGMKVPRRGERPPVNLAIVIDRSGSMGGDKIIKAREAAIEAVRRLDADDIVSLVAYDTVADVLIPAQRRGTGTELERAIARITPDGSTALYDGVSRGAAEVRRNLEDRRYVNRVILLSDGLANVGPSSPQELARLGGDLMREGISVTTIGLGLGFNEDLMTQLAQRSDGNTYFVENSRDLPGIFSAELGDVLSVVARRVVIELEFPDGVRPLAFVGRDGVIRGRKAELVLNQVYGGQEKFALIEVELETGRSGAEREIASAHVRYEDAIQQRTVTTKLSRRVKFSGSEAAVVKSANHKVQADYAANVLAQAKDEVVALVDANRNAEAGALLRRRAEALNREAARYSNTAVMSLAAPAAAEAQAVETGGLDNAKRKTYRADSAAVRGQQATSSTPGGR